VFSFFILDQADAVQSSHHSLVQVHYIVRLRCCGAQTPWDQKNVLNTELHVLISGCGVPL